MALLNTSRSCDKAREKKYPRQAPHPIDIRNVEAADIKFGGVLLWDLIRVAPRSDKNFHLLGSEQIYQLGSPSRYIFGLRNTEQMNW
nr:uncharacterized protein LOC120964455 isoform X3 [Aegilops tauschii subsp. strangulata]XP_045084729.1 uncharacterized protein LOC120964455 isoform X3 [Aegilops tauschii subsp. strangulata]XP_045084730.1 uncharacterized protein LOC120964455 isoform X3 [Aegilops tauschii subsp. strangulata]